MGEAREGIETHKQGGREEKRKEEKEEMDKVGEGRKADKGRREERTYSHTKGWEALTL